MGDTRKKKSRTGRQTLGWGKLRAQAKRIRVDVWVLVAAVIVAILALIPASLNWLEARRGNQIASVPAPRSEANVQVSALSLDDPIEIDATSSDYATETTEKTTTKAQVIDITVKNAGSKPALFTKASFEIEHWQALSNCSPEGGPVSTSAVYDVSIPMTIPSLPFVIERPLRYEVKPDAVDRLAFNVGIAEVPEGSALSIYHLKVSLHQDDRRMVQVIV